MVSAEKGEPEGRTGKRSRGASPNGHYSDFSDEERERGSCVKFDLRMKLPLLIVVEKNLKKF